MRIYRSTASTASAKRAFSAMGGQLPEVEPELLRLHGQVERWLALVAEQQEFAVALRKLVTEQRRLALLWDAADAADVASEAHDVEEGLSRLSTGLLHLEQLAVDKISSSIAQAHRLLLAP